MNVRDKTLKNSRKREFPIRILNTLDFDLLQFIKKNPETLSLPAKQKLRLAQPVFSQRIKELEIMGLVNRKRDFNQIRLTLTDKGKILFDLLSDYYLSLNSRKK